ncbi:MULTISPECIES: helix-turn-helix transcriptional regulator [unclassified Oceanobacillus]|uniref:helix-turn-helix transcriptional regulator n=1 Tax=unclassified Oceanobacillus TaxID=2630292 RepID=UPI001BE7FDB9|nr:MULTISPECIES: helix-turn-helix transcriptional regulator [unclassified Oceanobacillus]MBT2599121.1 helix-turn-helix transcriptional regulator [Oceanobacillus sp. ISL-74]MBT2652039.1 helix-turn-helix transcriptional regulator [Oceanobacillus sp. ISL-73]
MAYKKVGRCLLDRHLKENYMTQLELADKLGVSKQQINKYVLNKQKMSLEVAGNIAYILNCHVEDLYEWVSGR